MCAGKRVIGAVLIVVAVAFVVAVVVVVVLHLLLVVAPTHAFAARLGRVFFSRNKVKVNACKSPSLDTTQKKRGEVKKGKQKRREANKRTRTKSKRLLDHNLNDSVCHRKSFGLALVVFAAAETSSTASSSASSCGCSWLQNHICGLCCFSAASALFCCSSLFSALPIDSFDCSLMVCSDFVAIFL